MEQSISHSMLPPRPPNPRRQLSAQDWEEQRARIEQLYSTEDKSLEDVIHLMEVQYGFRATKRQYKTRISQWHLEKNVKDGEMQYIAQKQKKRKVREDKDTAFRVRSRTVEPEKITRTIKRKKISEDALLVAPSPPTPSDVSYFTPPVMGPLTPHSPYNQPPVSQKSSPNPGPPPFPTMIGSTPEMFAGQSFTTFANSPAFYGLPYSFTGHSPNPFPALPSNYQSPSSFWNTLHETAELGTTNVPDFEYHPETGEIKLTKLVQLIKDSEESADIDYTKTMLEVNSLVYDLIVEDEPKFDVLFDETPNANYSMCYICSGVKQIGKDQMAQKVESERLLLEAIAVSMGRFGEDANATLHFKYNLLVLYGDWSCREEDLPILVAQIVELALRRMSAGSFLLHLLYLIDSKELEDLVYSCVFHGSREYPAWLGRLLSILQGSFTASDEVVRDLQSKIWEMSTHIGIQVINYKKLEAIVPFLDLILRLNFTLTNTSSSVYFWTSVFVLAIGDHCEPLFNLRELIFQAITQTSLVRQLLLEFSNN